MPNLQLEKSWKQHIKQLKISPALHRHSGCHDKNLRFLKPRNRLSVHLKCLTSFHLQIQEMMARKSQHLAISGPFEAPPFPSFGPHGPLEQLPQASPPLLVETQRCATCWGTYLCLCAIYRLCYMTYPRKTLRVYVAVMTTALLINLLGLVVPFCREKDTTSTTEKTPKRTVAYQKVPSKPPSGTRFHHFPMEVMGQFDDLSVQHAHVQFANCWISRLP